MTDVLVVGAGPVGLTMAAELARHGVRSRIVDRLSQPTGYCKALGVTPRTLEVWEDMGVVRPMIDAGLWLTGMRMVVNGQLVKEVSAALSGFPYVCHLGLPQYDTEQVLADHLGRFGIVPERRVELLSVEDSGSDVAVRLQHADGRTENLDVRYVIGCDGAHSMVRKAAGIGFPGEAYPVEFMLGDVKVGWDMARGLAMRAVKLDDGEMTGFLVAVPLPDQGRYRLSSFAPFDPAGPEPGDAHGIQAERTPPSLADLQAVVDRLLPGTTLSDLRWSSIFRISMRIADAYRSGRLFVAGDAAHIHPPTGGQGMNTGIQDAYNLAWKLALVVQGRAPESLLDSYEAERRPVGLKVLERTIAQTQAFREGGKGGDSQLEDSQLLVNYRGSSWLAPDRVPATEGPAPGDRAPDAGGLRRHGLDMQIRLFDLLHGTDHVLLACVSDLSAAERVAALATTLRTRFGRHLRIYGIAADPLLADLPGVPVLLDELCTFSQAYGSVAGAAWIVRPDGYVGLRTAELREEDVLRYFEKILRPHGPLS